MILLCFDWKWPYTYTLRSATCSIRAMPNKVTKYVTFDERLFYGSNEDLSVLSGLELQQVINCIELPHDQSDTETASEDELNVDADGSLHADVPSTANLLDPPSDQLSPGPSSDQTSNQNNAYPSPVSMVSENQPYLPNSAHLHRERKRYKTNQHIDQTNVLSQKRHRPAFAIANPVHTYWHTFVTASNQSKARIHRSELPPVPQYWNELFKLPNAHQQGFLHACRKELETIKRKNTYVERHLSEIDVSKIEILPLTWVFKYKFDNEGFLTKYKARICARGDLQTTSEDTYAATLAVRIFRALMALAAYFNMEIRQYDAVDAFTNASLPSPVYTYQPEGFGDSLHIWELRTALYGLKTSPQLWYKDLTQNLRDLGLEPILDCPCLWKSDRLIVLFFVDDIMVMAKPGHTSEMDEFERKLCKRYEITILNDRNTQTFCGITTFRDRENGDVWLSQKDYLETIYHRYPSPKPVSKVPATPLPFEELVPSTDATIPGNQLRYAQIVGSIGYAAGATRPDVAKAHSKLSEFLTNPSAKHISAAYQCLAYLYHTRHQALHYSASHTDHQIHLKDHEEIDFYGATDASYADHTATWKSSQGWIFFLFGGPIDWKATLQRCVTKSTTEAELIAASSGATELIWWWRVFKSLNVQIDNEQLLFCDNQQTIRFLTSEAPKLKTTLRHVDIHHHWLREASQNKTIEVAYIETKTQPADGLTKLLPRQRHENWVTLLNFDTVPESVPRELS